MVVAACSNVPVKTKQPPTQLEGNNNDSTSGSTTTRLHKTSWSSSKLRLYMMRHMPRAPHQSTMEIHEENNDWCNC
eukprot:4943602-Amphidinium_carterae.1